MRDSHQQGIREGMQVRSGDGRELGTIIEVDVTEEGVGPENGILIVGQAGDDESGGAEPPLRIPLSVVHSVQGDSVLLDLSAEDARRGRWGAERTA